MVNRGANNTPIAPNVNSSPSASNANAVHRYLVRTAIRHLGSKVDKRTLVQTHQVRAVIINLIGRLLKLLFLSPRRTIIRVIMPLSPHGLNLRLTTQTA